MKSQKMIGIVIKSGWRVVRQKGSHIHFRHFSCRGLVTVPHPVLDLPKGTIKSILRQAGMSIPMSLLGRP